MKSLSRHISSTRNGLLWVLFGFGSLLLLWGFRMPGGDLPFLLTGAALVAAALLFVIARIVTRFVLILGKRPGVVPVFMGWHKWLLCAAVVAVILIVGTNGLPFRWAFALSRPQLEQLVESHDGVRTAEGNLWAGLFPIASVEPIDGGCQFTFRKHEFPWGKRGIYYSASGKRIDSSHFYSQERIGAKWFVWHHGGW